MRQGRLTILCPRCCGGQVLWRELSDQDGAPEQRSASRQEVLSSDLHPSLRYLCPVHGRYVRAPNQLRHAPRPARPHRQKQFDPQCRASVGPRAFTVDLQERRLPTSLSIVEAVFPLILACPTGWTCPPMNLPLSSIAESGAQVLHAAHLPPLLDASCRGALSRPGRLFSPTPLWARLFLAWVEALAAPPRDVFLPAAVACELMIAGYDLIDAASDQATDVFTHGYTESHIVPGLTLLLLAQDVVAHLNLPAERRVQAGAALVRAGRRALGAHTLDMALRQASVLPPPKTVLTVLRQRSGTLVAAPCQCAAFLTGSPWRTVALAGRFGQALGCAVQLEDDLADREADEQGGRRTIPVLLIQRAPELVDPTTRVLIRRFLHEAAQALTQLPLSPSHTEALWTLLPIDLRPV